MGACFIESWSSGLKNYAPMRPDKNPFCCLLNLLQNGRGVISPLAWMQILMWRGACVCVSAKLRANSGSTMQKKAIVTTSDHLFPQKCYDKNPKGK